MDLEAKLRDPRLQVSEGKCPPAPDEARLSTIPKKKLPATGGESLTLLNESFMVNAIKHCIFLQVRFRWTGHKPLSMGHN